MPFFTKSSASTLAISASRAAGGAGLCAVADLVIAEAGTRFGFTETRLGLVPATIVARELDIRLIETVCVVSYSHQTQGQLQVLKGVAANIVALAGGEGKGVLIVDDLVDTGKTAKVVRELSAEQQAGLLGISRHYVENAQRFSKGLKKIA